MIGGLTAVVVQYHRLTHRLCDSDGGQRREQKRKIGRGEHVYDIGAAELAKEQGPVAHLSDQGAQAFDAQEPLERPWRERIDRDQPRVDGRIGAPRVE